MLDIRLLGSPVVTLDGSPVEVDTRKAIAILAYLAVEKTANRDVLASLFWADSPADRSRAALRRTLSSLRGGIGASSVFADRSSVGLVGELSCDLEEFDSLVTETAGHDHDPSDVCSACIAPLDRAARLYRGDFLGAFAVRDAPDFEDWARPIVESFRLAAGEVLHRLAMAHAAEGAYPAAIAAAKRWTALDELHEPAHRMTMLLHAWAGDRPGAIQAYRDCVAVLDRELGVAPLEETTELFEAILDEDLPPAPGARRRVKTHPGRRAASPGEMLDRIPAIEAVHRLLDDAVGNRLLLLTGDSWMGKTRLLEHVFEVARQGQHQVVTATAFRAESALPYGVAVQLLGGLTSVVDAGATPEWVWEELNRLDPRLAPASPAPDTGQPGQLRLSEAFLTLAENVAAKRPLLVAVDDAQWVDPASAHLVEYLRRHGSEVPVLLILSARNTESLHPVLREMAGESDETIELHPLRSDDLGSHGDGALLDEVIRATGGIPLLVKEAIDSGGVDPESSTVLRYIDSRRRRMTDLGHQVLAAAAVLNGMCDPSLLRETSGRTEEEIVEAVEELVEAGLLREQDDGRLAFTLDVLETITYESTSLVRRRLLHRRVAEALAARPRSGGDVRFVAAIAEHARAAGSDDAPHWYRRAGDLARIVFANDEAASSYEVAIALGHPDVGELHLAIGELAIADGDYDRARRELRTAASHAEGATLALVEHRLGDLHRILGRFELAEESFSRAEPHHPEPSGLHSDWALLRHRVGDDDTAIDLASRAEREARDSGDNRALARALNILGMVTPDVAIAAGYIDAALDLTEEQDPARIGALNNKAHLLGSSGDLSGAISLVEEAIALARRTGFRHHQAALLNHLADLYHQKGDTLAAEKTLTDAVTLFADIGTGDWEPEVWLIRQW